MAIKTAYKNILLNTFSDIMKVLKLLIFHLKLKIIKNK